MNKIGLLLSICTISLAALSNKPKAYLDSVAVYQFTNAPKTYQFLQRIEKIKNTLPDSLKGKFYHQLGIYYAIQGKNYWQEFELKFTALHPDFLQKLQKAHPILTKKEADFCALVRLNLSNKEIASLIQISYESVISKKYKLRKKLGYKTDNEFLAFMNELT